MYSSERNYKMMAYLKSAGAAVALATGIFAFSGVASIANAVVTKTRAQWKTEYVWLAEIPFPEENPYSKFKVDLGRTLFFDPRLSGANYTPARPATIRASPE